MPKKSSTTSFSKGSKGLKQWTASNLEDVRRLAAEREHSSNKDTSNGYISSIETFLKDFPSLQRKFSAREVSEKIRINADDYSKSAAYKKRTDTLDKQTNHSSKCYNIDPKVLSYGSTPLTAIVFIASPIPVNHEIMLNGVESVKMMISESNLGAVALSTTTYVVMMSPKGGPNSPAIEQDQVCNLDVSIVFYTYDASAPGNIRMVMVKEDNKDFPIRRVVDKLIR